MRRKRLVIIASGMGALLVLLIAVPDLIDVNNYRPTIEAALGSPFRGVDKILDRLTSEKKP